MHITFCFISEAHCLQLRLSGVTSTAKQHLSSSTCGGSHPGQTQHPVIKISVGEDIGQAVVIMVLLRVKLQELLHPDVGEAERVGAIPLITGRVDLQRGWRRVQREDADKIQLLTRNSTHKSPCQETHPDPFHHETDVANAHEVCTLIDGINSFDMTGDLKQRDKAQRYS